MEEEKQLLLEFYDLKHEAEDFRAEVIKGLTKPQKETHAKYFYDERGSQLFDEISEQPEYYLTRADIAILEEHCAKMGEMIGERALLIEFGSGNIRKIRVLLSALKDPLGYMPIDISKEYLQAFATLLAEDYPQLAIMAVCGDFTRLDSLPEITVGRPQRRVIFFPGSTIGNLTYAEAMHFLQLSARLLRKDDAMIIGVDLKKDARILNAAYNDARGVTAQFNLNILRRINEELGANFNLDAFAHHAFYNEAEGRIEMHLISLKNQTVKIGDREISFKKDETIHTENSYKYSIEDFHSLARKGGFTPVKVWTDRDNLFSEHYLVI